jgi:YegS/Rv2252/BmrU family lipid kinase
MTGERAGEPAGDLADPPPRTVGVVFNPASGGEKADERRDHLREALADAGVTFEWFETTKDDPGRGQARQAVDGGAELVVACGGDGTVMACAAALAGGEVPLAVLPLGTGNLVAANFDIPSDLDEALEIALVCRRRRIDVGAFEDDRFVIMAGMGIDAAMLRDTDTKLKARIGPLAYVVGAARNLRRPRRTFRITLDGGEPITRAGQGVLVGNLGKLQGGLPALPDAVPDDGVFDIAVIRTRNLADWGAVVLHAVFRRRQPRPLVETFRARKVELHCDRPQPVERDGDPVSPRQDMTVEIVPRALTLAVPAHQVEGSAPVRQGEHEADTKPGALDAEPDPGDAGNDGGPAPAPATTGARRQRGGPA